MKEYSIRRTLKQLARQRVARVHNPGNYWIIEKAMPKTKKNEANLQTCLMRGWVKLLHESVPTRKLGKNLEIDDSKSECYEHVYGLTESGWNVIHRNYSLFFLSVVISVIGVVVAVLNLILQEYGKAILLYIKEVV